MDENDIQRILAASSSGPVDQPTAAPDELTSAVEQVSRGTDQSFSEAAAETGIGVAQGALEGTAMTLGPYAGTKLGMAIGAPFGPVGIGVGGTLGFLTGAGAGMLAQQSLNELFPGVPREDLAPYREGGRTFGQTMAVAPYAFRIPVSRAKDVALFLKSAEPALRNIPNGIAAGKTGEFAFKILALAGETAKKYPKSFLAGEALGGVGAGVGAGIAEAYFPGEGVPRFTSEVVGGFLAPGRMLVTSGGNARDFLGQLASTLSRDSREGIAADKLRTMLIEAGEDPSVIARRLRQDEPLGSTLTAAQKSRSDTLSALQSTLVKNNAQYGADIRKQAEDSFRAHELLLKRLEKIGNPDALRKAAEIRQTYFDDMIKTRLVLADAEAARLASRITSDTPQNRVAIGEIVKRQTDEALRDAREHESMLWKNAYRDAVETTTDAAGNPIVVLKQVRPNKVGEEFLDIVSSMTEARFKSRMPAEIKEIMRGMGIDDAAIKRYQAGRQTQEFLDTGTVPQEYLMRPVASKEAPSQIILPPGVTRPETPVQMESIFKNVDAQEMIKARGDLLSFARDASARGELDNAHFYGRLAESILDDLQQLNSTAYDSARQFSRTLNDVFTRSYAGDVAMGKLRTGAEKVPAEILVSRAFGSNADATAMRMQEIQEAVGLMQRQYDNAVSRFGVDSPQALELRPFAEAATGRVDSIWDAQQRVLRLAASKTIDPQTGRVNPAQLQRFVNENKTMLDQFGITNDLVDAAQAENVFKAIRDSNSYANRKLLKETAFAQVLARENPTLAITDILNSKYPVKNFQRVTQLAKAGGPDAVDGLKSIMYDYAFSKAGGLDNFDVGAFRKALFEPLAPGKPSILNMMRSQGVISKDEVKNLLSIIRPMERIEAAQQNQRLMNDLVENADVITEFGLRVLGSKIGRFASPAGSSSLIAAQAGSSAVRNIFDKQPTIMIRGIIEEATKDPYLMAMLLERGRARDQSFRASRNMHAYLGAAGLNYADLDASESPEQRAPEPGTTLRPRPPAPVTRGTPNMQLPTDQGPAGQAQQAQPPGQAPGMPTQSRQMLQQLFPFDATLQAAPQGQ